MKKRSRFLSSFLGLLVSLGLAGFALPENSTNPRPRTFEERLDAIEAKLSELETRVNHIQPSQPAPREAAAAPATVAEPLEARFEALDQKIGVMERKKDLSDEAGAAQAKSTPSVLAGKDGFGFKSGDSNFQFKVGGYVQADSRFPTSHDALRAPGAATFVLRRVRPIFEGTVYKYFDFRVMPDFGGGQTVLEDSYLDFTYFPSAKIRFGKAKPPLGLERLVPASELLFVERAFPSSLIPNRDLGVQILGENLGGGVLNYGIGIFNGVVDGGSGDVDTNNTKDFAGRVFILPLGKTSVGALQGLGVGISGTAGSQDGALPSFRTSGQNTFFTYTMNTVAAGHRHRISPQAYYYWNSFGLLGEYVQSNQDVRRGTVVREINNQAWQVAGSYVLTGEKASYQGVVPAKMFNPHERSFGAFELTGRYHQLNVDNDAFILGFADPTRSARQAKAWTLGVNWYFNRNLKLNLNYEQTRFTQGSATGDRPTEKLFLSRFQVYF